jgi:hypothetical protein
MSRTILERWEISSEDLTDVIDANPSLRGIMLGYVAELKLRQMWFPAGEVDACLKPDDHDRLAKCDLVVTYKGERLCVEVKSVQTNSIRRSEGKITARFQCDASDRREVILPNGKRVTTTCLKTNDFDIVAVNLYAFEDKWRFAFARNCDLPRTTHKAYTAYQRKHLLASLMPITCPLEAPFREEPFGLFEEIITERNRRRHG